MALTTYVEAIRQGIWEEMEQDERVFVLGEDVGAYGGAFKVTAGFLDEVGDRRVVDTPISESAIVGAAFFNRGRASRQRPFEASSSPRAAEGIASGACAADNPDSTANEHPHNIR